MPSLCAAVQAAVCTESRGQPRLESRWLDQPSEVWIAWSAAVGASAHTLHINTRARASPRANPGLPSHSSQVVGDSRPTPQTRERPPRRGVRRRDAASAAAWVFFVCHLEVNNDKMSIVRVPGGGAGLRAREGGGARGGGSAPPAAPTNPNPGVEGGTNKRWAIFPTPAPTPCSQPLDPAAWRTPAPNPVLATLPCPPRQFLAP